jgi:Glycosyl transferase 4-like domain/Glycosyl transferases group 1
MRILILTFYFPPDLSAGSFRIAALVNQILPRLPAGARVDLLTTRPNRYASLDVDAPECETRGALRIERISLPEHRSGMLDQAKAFVVFYRAVSRLVHRSRYDLVFATSSRLMTAFLGARIARQLNVPLYLDIRDIFVDTIKDVLPGIKGKLLLPVLAQVERFTIRSATRINFVSEGFREYFDTHYPGIHSDFFTNGIDEEFLAETWPDRGSPQGPTIRVLYAGNIGEGQGLHRIIPTLALLAGSRYCFSIVGDGGRANQLREDLKREGIQNVEVLPPVSRDVLIQMYQTADVLFLHLNDYEAFSKVLPSKIFEYAATGKPMLAGVAGHAAKFLRGNVANCEVFEPCDAGAGVTALKALTLRTSRREEFINVFARSKIMHRMAESVLRVVTTRELSDST